ncbi:MAG: exonuclease domain-containing protein, partial [Burkholderiales bacterium]
MRQLIVDTETTGLDPLQGHRIIEFAALEMIDRQLTGKHLHLYINPQRSIDPDATRIHGIKDEDVMDKPTF